MDNDITDEDLQLGEHLSSLEAGQLDVPAQVCEFSQNTLQEIFNDDYQWQSQFQSQQMNDKYVQCLNKHFRHDLFRGKQLDVITAIVEKRRDNLVCMATGYGKSLLFQLPSVFLNGITLIISPLISLMQDQVLSLQQNNIPACYLGSAQQDKFIDEKIIAGLYRLVYACPEFFDQGNGQNLLKRLKDQLTLVAVDEAHCVRYFCCFLLIILILMPHCFPANGATIFGLVFEN